MELVKAMNREMCVRISTICCRVQSVFSALLVCQMI
jgi:hypothetical protein